MSSDPRSTAARGYGAEHRAQRERWQKLFRNGHTTPCACTHADCPHHVGPCSTIITSSTPWDLGHTDDRTAWTGPECLPCNRSAGGRNSRVSQQNPMTIREWCQPIDASV